MIRPIYDTLVRLFSLSTPEEWLCLLFVVLVILVVVLILKR